MNIGDILKNLRLDRGLKQNDIAQMLNIKRQTYSSWERNNSIPDIATVAYLANFYDVSTDYILGLTNLKIKLEDLSSSDILKGEIDKLSNASLEELKNYIELLKLKDEIDKTKEEQSSALQKDA